VKQAVRWHINKAEVCIEVGKSHRDGHSSIAYNYKKFELMLTRRAKAYSSSNSVV